MRYLPCLVLAGSLAARGGEEPASIQFFRMRSAAGGAVTLEWAATGTDRVWLEPPGLDFPAQGSVARTVRSRTIFWLHAANLAGSQSRPLVVEPPPAAAPGGAWIQYGAMDQASSAEQLRRDLLRLAGVAAVALESAAGDPAGKVIRVRSGPFRSRTEALRRLRDLRRNLAPLRIRPFVVWESGPVGERNPPVGASKG